MLGFLSTICVLSSTISPSQSGPLPDHNTVGWVSDPNGRGTFGLVTSYVFTLSLCVLSAMHLNILPRYKTKWEKWQYNTVDFPWNIYAGAGNSFGLEIMAFCEANDNGNEKILEIETLYPIASKVYFTSKESFLVLIVQ